MSRNSGFTLIEMMIVIAVIGILLSVSTPAIIRWLPNYRLKSVASDLVSNFQKAKLEAVKRNTNVLIKFTTGAYTPSGRVGNYQIFVDNGAGGGTANNGTRDGTELILVQESMPQNVSLYFANFSGSTTAAGYNSRGLPWNERIGNVKLQNKNSIYYQATLSFTGHIRLEKSTDGVNWN